MLKPIQTQYSRDMYSAKGEPTWTESWAAEVKTYAVPITDFTYELSRFGGADYDDSFDFASAVLSRPELNDFAYELAHAKNQKHFDFIADSLQRNAARREVLYNTSFLTSLGVAVFNPLNWVFAFPALGVVKGAITGTQKIRAAAAAGARQGFAGSLALEAMRYPFDPLESEAEVITNVAAGTAFGGAIGGAIPSGFHLFKHVMPEATRRIAPYVGRAEKNLESFEEGRIDSTFNMAAEGEPELNVDVMYTDDLAAPVIQRKQEVKETVIETVVVYDKNGKPVRANVIDRDDKTSALSYEVDGVIYRSDEDSPFFTTDPVDPNTVPSPLVLDTGVTPMIADLNEFELDQALTYLRDEFDSVEGEAAELVDRQISAIERMKGERDIDPLPESRTVREETDQVILNIDRIRDDYETLKFTHPEVEGATGLAKNDFRTFEDYHDFIIRKERRKTLEKKGKDETAAEFEDRLNSLAIADGAAGWGIKQTAFTDFHRNGPMKFLKSPAFRVLNDPNMPEGIKRIMALMTGNNKIALNRNTAGFGTNAVDQQAVRGSVRFRQTLERLQDIWISDVKGKSEAFRSRFFGFSEADWVLGRTSFDDWFRRSMEIYIDDVPGPISTSQARVNKEIKYMLDDFLDMAQDDGMLLGIENYDVEISRLKQEIEYKESRIAALSKDPDKAVQLQSARDELNELIDGPDGLRAMEDAKMTSGGKSSYRWPRYFDVLALTKSEKGDKVLYNELRDLLIDEYSRMPPRQRYNPKTKKMEEYISDPIKDADETLSKIIRDENNPEAYIGEGHKGKHLKRRVLNIPDSKLSKFLVKDVSVLGAYADKMGFRMAWKKNFGDKSLRQVLNDIETIGRDSGISDDMIDQARKAFYGDYLRATGTHIQNPHRLDNQIAKIASDYTGIVHLAGSGMTATADLINMISARSLRDMIESRKDLGKLFDNVEDLEGFVEVLSMSPNMIKEQLMADAKTGLKPTLAEKVTHLPSKVMFNLPVIGNDLHAITSATRRIASAYNISDIIKIAFKIADPDQTPTAFELQTAGAMGIDERVAEFIYRQRDVIQKGKSIYYANTKEWDIKDANDRDSYQNFLTAIDIATDGQIIMAKSFDKPLIVDGVTFVRFHPIMKTLFGMEPDPVISRNGRSYARIQSGFLKFPFQFFNYSFGAANSVLGRAFDPQQENRLMHIALSVAYGYLLLKMTKPDWWFEDKDTTEIAMRSVDRSGVAAIYGDLIYDAIHMATATGAVDPEDMPVRGKFAANETKHIFGPVGPAPNLSYDFYVAASDYINDRTTANAREFSKTLPRIVTPFVTLDFAGFHKKFLNE